MSSTLQELAAERRAVRDAVTSLRLVHVSGLEDEYRLSAGPAAADLCQVAGGRP